MSGLCLSAGRVPGEKLFEIRHAYQRRDALAGANENSAALRFAPGYKSANQRTEARRIHVRNFGQVDDKQLKRIESADRALKRKERLDGERTRAGEQCFAFPRTS